MRAHKVKQLAKNILLSFLLAFLIFKAFTGLAISEIPTILTNDEESELLPVCSNRQFSNNLYPHYFDDRVECLQLLLKQNPKIYPEGLVTGFYGPLTRMAVAHFNQLIKNSLDTENYFFDYTTRLIINKFVGEQRINFIKNLTLPNNTTSSSLPSSTNSSIPPTPTTVSIIVAASSSTTLNTSTSLPLAPSSTISNTTTPVSVTSSTKIVDPKKSGETSLSWLTQFKTWIWRIFPFSKNTFPTNSVATRTISSGQINETNLIETNKLPSFLEKIMIGLSKLKIFNISLLKSSEKEIISFSFPTLKSYGIIDVQHHTIKINVPNGTDLKNLKPTIVISPKATITPPADKLTDYSRPIIYTVTAENKSNLDYTITVLETAKSSENTILGFKVKEYDSTTIIDNQFAIITLTLSLQADITKLTVLIEASPYTEINPTDNTLVDLSKIKTVSVKAQNGDLKVYNLRVIKQATINSSSTTTTIETPTTLFKNPANEGTTSSTTSISTTSTSLSPSTSIPINPTTNSTVPITLTSTSAPISTSTTQVAVTTSTSMTITSIATVSTVSVTSTTIPLTTTATKASTSSSSTTKTTLIKKQTPPSAIAGTKFSINFKTSFSNSWQIILLGFLAISILELIFVLIKTNTLNKIIGRTVSNTRFTSCLVINSKAQAALDQGKHLIILSIPNGEEILASQISLTRISGSRLMSYPQPNAVIKNGDSYVLVSLEGDQIVYKVKIKQL